MLQPQEETVFNDRDAQDMALGRDNPELASIKFRVEEKYSKLKSEGGIVRFDRYSAKDSQNLDRLKADLEKFEVTFKEVVNERDDTIDLKVQGKGHPVYDLVDYIEIISDKTDIKDRPVTEGDKLKYARRYNAWKAGKGAEAIGLPLSQWPGVTKSMVNELANHGIHTVEQLGSIADGIVARIGPIQSLKQKAKAYLESAKGLAPISQMQAENRQLKEQLEALQAQMTEFAKAQAPRMQDEVPATPIKPKRVKMAPTKDE